MPTFPVDLAREQDSKFYSAEFIDNAVKGEIEGGYAHSRPRTTRPPRSKWTTGFTDIGLLELEALEAFYREVGTHTAFDWTHPITGVVESVKFDKPIRSKYIGAGGNHRFNVEEIVLVQQ